MILFQIQNKRKHIYYLLFCPIPMSSHPNNNKNSTNSSTHSSYPSLMKSVIPKLPNPPQFSRQYINNQMGQTIEAINNKNGCSFQYFQDLYFLEDEEYLKEQEEQYDYFAFLPQQAEQKPKKLFPHNFQRIIVNSEKEIIKCQLVKFMYPLQQEYQLWIKKRDPDWTKKKEESKKQSKSQPKKEKKSIFEKNSLKAEQKKQDPEFLTEKKQKQPEKVENKKQVKVQEVETRVEKIVGVEKEIQKNNSCLKDDNLALLNRNLNNYMPSNSQSQQSEMSRLPLPPPVQNYSNNAQIKIPFQENLFSDQNNGFSPIPSENNTNFNQYYDLNQMLIHNNNYASQQYYQKKCLFPHPSLPLISFTYYQNPDPAEILIKNPLCSNLLIPSNINNIQYSRPIHQSQQSLGDIVRVQEYNGLEIQQTQTQSLKRNIIFQFIEEEPIEQKIPFWEETVGISYSEFEDIGDMLVENIIIGFGFRDY